MLSELYDCSFVQHCLDAASPSVKSPTTDAHSMHPVEADEWNTVMVSRWPCRFLPTPPDGDERVQLSKVAQERETEGVPVRMRGIAPPLGALQDVSVVSWPGVEAAISTLSPVERERHTRVHLMVWRIEQMRMCTR